MENNENTTFRFHGIKELGFKYEDPMSVLGNKVENANIEGKFDINYRWNINQNLFAVVFDFVYNIPDSDSDKKEFLRLSVMSEFFVENLNKVFTVRSNNDFDMDEKLETTLVSIAISTVRGILFEKCKGTFFNNAILPLMNPPDLILSKKNKKANNS